jgi:hypothetical protein
LRGILFDRAFHFDSNTQATMAKQNTPKISTGNSKILNRPNIKKRKHKSENNTVKIRIKINTESSYESNSSHLTAISHKIITIEKTSFPLYKYLNSSN